MLFRSFVEYVRIDYNCIAQLKSVFPVMYAVRLLGQVERTHAAACLDVAIVRIAYRERIALPKLNIEARIENEKAGWVWDCL